MTTTFDKSIGTGIVAPFQFAGDGDFKVASGKELIDANIGQVLGTACDGMGQFGELPWRTEFGSVLRRLRHAPNKETLRGLAKHFVGEAIQRWEPRARIIEVDVVVDEVASRKLQLVIQRQVLVEGETTADLEEVLVPLSASLG